ncbi:hypothetical protein B0H17DRAFT_1069234 [Mycena rosella]|uniref:Secreted protein n=1 Tax=Mycena rosella TaxID=1033263 RepID=A0AAD7DCB1_MYCRO|nr:hypothetical protein B0H17DRAFT_1069234 [Mycena rosella]
MPLVAIGCAPVILVALPLRSQASRRPNLWLLRRLCSDCHRDRFPGTYLSPRTGSLTRLLRVLTSDLRRPAPARPLSPARHGTFTPSPSSRAWRGHAGRAGGSPVGRDVDGILRAPARSNVERTSNDLPPSSVHALDRRRGRGLQYQGLCCFIRYGGTTTAMRTIWTGACWPA